MRDMIRLSNELLNIKRNMDKFIENFLKPTPMHQEEESSFTPLINAVETKDELRLYVLIPFGKKDKISLNIKDNILTIEGETSFEPNKDSELIRSEIPTGHFSRSFKISINIDPSKAKASYKDGILQIVLPKKEEAKSNQIEIE